jgi:hypothetical protein
MLQGVLGQSGVRRDAHLAQDATPIRADGGRAARHRFGDFGNGLARRKQAKHLVFPFREPLMRKAFAVSADIQRQPLGKCRG